MKKSRYGAAFIILAALLFLFLILNICIGSVNIPVSEIPKMLWGNGADETFTDIVMGIRFPRAMAAAILGGGLALSGYLLQTFFHNPIAGPFTLGISSGAKLVVALVMVASLGNALHLSSWVMIMAAFVGSMICMGFVILMSKVTDQMSMLIVSGVMIGYICSAITDFVVTFADDADIVNLHNWSKGSFSGITWDNVVIMAIVVWVVLEKTKFGFELKATGMNKNAAKYCGMKEKRNIIVTMMIAGGLAGLGAAAFYLSGIETWMVQQTTVPGMGFNGIAAAFLGGLNPIGTIFSSYFIQHITSGGSYVDKTMYCTQISDLISAFIIYLCGFVFFFKLWLNRYLDKRDEKKAAKELKGGEK